MSQHQIAVVVGSLEAASVDELQRAAAAGADRGLATTRGQAAQL